MMWCMIVKLVVLALTCHVTYPYHYNAWYICSRPITVICRIRNSDHVYRQQSPTIILLKSSIRNNDQEKDPYTEIMSSIEELSNGNIKPSDFEEKVSMNEAKLRDYVKLKDDAKRDNNLMLERGTLVGSAGIGIIIGLLIDLQTYDQVNPIVPPLLSSTFLIAAMYYVLNNDKFDTIASYGKQYIGQPTIDAQRSLLQSLDSYVEATKIAVKEKAASSINDIKNIPTNTRIAIIGYYQGKSNELQTAVQETQVRAKNSINKKINDIRDEINQTIQSQVDNIKSAPGKAISTTKARLDSSVAYTIALPNVILDSTKATIQRRVDETKSSISSTVLTMQTIFQSLNPFSDRASKQSIESKTTSYSPSIKQMSRTGTEALSTGAVITTKPSSTKVDSMKATSTSIQSRSEVKPSLVAISRPKIDEIKPTTATTTSSSKGFSFSSFQLKLPSVASTVKIPKSEIVKSAPSTKSTPLIKSAPSTKSAPLIKSPPSITSAPSIKSTVVVKQSPTPLASKSKAQPTVPVVSKVIVNAPTLKVSDTPTANLSGAIVKKITSFRTITSTAVVDIDRAFKNYSNGESNPDRLYRVLSTSLGSKDAAFQVLPDLVGSLPKGSLKSALFNYYQQNA